MEANNLIEVTTARTDADLDGALVVDVTVRRDDAADHGHARAFRLTEGDRVWVRWQESDAATSTSVVLVCRRDDDAPTGVSLGILTDGPVEVDEHSKRGVVYRTTATTVRVGLLPRAPKGHVDRAGAVSLGRPAVDNILMIPARVQMGVA